MLGFVAVGGVMSIIATLLPKRDVAAECKAHCGQRFHRLVPDLAWGTNKSGEPARHKCECY